MLRVPCETLTCFGADDCNDMEECTVDTCQVGTCVNTPVADTTPCTPVQPGATGACIDGRCVPVPSQTPTSSRTPSGSRTRTPSNTGTRTSSASPTSVPTTSVTSSASRTPTPSQTATRTRAPSVTPSSTPSNTGTGTPSPSTSMEPECTVGCSLSKGAVRNSKKISWVWDLPEVVCFKLCGETMDYWMDAKISGKRAVVPDGIDANQYKDWLKWVQQWWTVTFSLRRFGCSVPKPAQVGVQYEAASAWLADPANCFVPSVNTSGDTQIFDDWANGEYADGSYDEFSGPVHCNDCDCQCWADGDDRDEDCDCTSCLLNATNKRRSVDLPGVRMTDADAYRVDCCLPDARELAAASSDELLSTQLCDGTTISEALHRPSQRINHALALARTNAAACMMAPVFAQNAFDRLLSLSERQCAGENISDIDFESFLAPVDAYNAGEYGLLGGPCACSDTDCTDTQHVAEPHHVNSLEEIIKFSPRHHSSGSKDLSGGSIALIVVGIVLLVAALVFIVAVGRRATAGPAYVYVSSERGATDDGLLFAQSENDSEF